MDRKETTKFLGELLERQYLSGLGKHWAKEVNIDPGSARTHRHQVFWRSPEAVNGRIVILHVKERKMRFKKGDVIRHFKREMLTKEQIEENGTLFTYEFLGVAEHTETKEKLVLYKALYDGESIGLPVKKGDIFARPYDMFFSEVDHQKYPGIKQKYRFEF